MRIQAGWNFRKGQEIHEATADPKGVRITRLMPLPSRSVWWLAENDQYRGERVGKNTMAFAE
jgi:hypothetical protein